MGLGMSCKLSPKYVVVNRNMKQKNKSLTLSMQVKNSSRWHFETNFLFFFPEKGLTFHNLHEMSNPIFWENKKNNLQKIVQRVIRVNIPTR